MTETDYAAIARVLRIAGNASPAEQRRQIICWLTNLFLHNDPRFDSRAFIEAAGLPR